MPTTKRKTPARKTPVAKKTPTTSTNNKEPGLLENFNREDNIHMFIGIILLVIGLWQLKEIVLGLAFIIVGILFVTGYFEKGKKK